MSRYYGEVGIRDVIEKGLLIGHRRLICVWVGDCQTTETKMLDSAAKKGQAEAKIMN